MAGVPLNTLDGKRALLDRFLVPTMQRIGSTRATCPIPMFMIVGRIEDWNLEPAPQNRTVR